jgi:hypothetical protein
MRCRCETRKIIKVNKLCPIHGEKSGFLLISNLHTKSAKRLRMEGITKAPKRGEKAKEDENETQEEIAAC